MSDECHADASSRTSQPAKMKTILVVDDELSIVTAWKRILQFEGYRVVTASVVFHSVWNLNGYLRELPSAGCRVRFWSI
jgi:PleD family two-component response regulator